MANGIYSFSASQKADKEFVEDIAIRARQQGISFSWLVLQALREYDAKKKEKANAGK
jgi:hypothetical protein